MTTDQLPLWPELVEPDYGPDESLDERFAVFHMLNPHVADRLEDLACQLVAAGRTRIGVKMLVEVLRWQQQLDTIAEPYKLNNSYSSRYARLLADRNPCLAGVFETRVLACERVR